MHAGGGCLFVLESKAAAFLSWLSLGELGYPMVRAHPGWVYILDAMHPRFLTTLAFWLRSSVVSVLNSLTTIMEVPPPLLVI